MENLEAAVFFRIFIFQPRNGRNRRMEPEICLYVLLPCKSKCTSPSIRPKSTLQDPAVSRNCARLSPIIHRTILTNITDRYNLPFCTNQHIQHIQTPISSKSIAKGQPLPSSYALLPPSKSPTHPAAPKYYGTRIRM